MTKKDKQEKDQPENNTTEPKDEFTQLKEKCEEYLNGWQRAKADYENLKKDTARQVAELVEFSRADLILEVLSIYDHFKMALAHQPEGQDSLKDWLVGIDHIKKEFEGFLKKFDIEEIKTDGAKFDPNFHEAISREESDLPADTIIKELKPGYLIAGKVLQPAQVTVAGGKSEN